MAQQNDHEITLGGKRIKKTNSPIKSSYFEQNDIEKHDVGVQYDVIQAVHATVVQYGNVNTDVGVQCDGVDKIQPTEELLLANYIRRINDNNAWGKIYEKLRREDYQGASDLFSAYILEFPEQTTEDKILKFEQVIHIDRSEDKTLIKCMIEKMGDIFNDYYTMVDLLKKVDLIGDTKIFEVLMNDPRVTESVLCGVCMQIERPSSYVILLKDKRAQECDYIYKYVFQVACERGWDDIVDIITSWPAGALDPVIIRVGAFSACNGGHSNIVKILYQKGLFTHQLASAPCMKEAASAGRHTGLANYIGEIEEILNPKKIQEKAEAREKEARLKEEQDRLKEQTESEKNYPCLYAKTP